MQYLTNLWNALDFGSLESILLRLAAVFLCLTIHETCHGLAAYALGDPTAKRAHRLSLNPLRHIDWIGFVMMIVAGFGWAKPVPVNPNYFKKPKQGMAITALAGPVSNFVLALLLLLTVFPKRQALTQKEAKARTNFFASRAFRLLFFSILLYVGLENGISYFAESLFSVRLSAGDLAAAAISAYWIGMTVSRMLFSAVLRNPKKTLIGCFLASAAFLLALAVSKKPTVSLVCCFAAGFSYGPIWSTLVAQATGLFPEASAGAAGVMSAGCGIGGMIFPVLMGTVCDIFSISMSFFFLAFLALGGFFLCDFAK